ncbi:MAG: PAS domain S-box protein [Acidobacteria bacterium]|nr:PAS domain S-box protein [Acidobacteriota bacterium]
MKKSKRFAPGISRPDSLPGAPEPALSPARLQQILEASPAALYVLDYPSSEIHWLSGNILRMTGFEISEALQPGWWRSNVHPEDRDRILRFAALSEDQDFLTSEFRFRKKDGTYFWVHDEGTVVHNPEGGPKEIVGSWIDISDRKEAELALRESERKLHHVMDASPSVTYVLDARSLPPKCTWISENVERLTGLNKLEAMEPMSWETRIHPDDLSAVHLARETYSNWSNILEYRFKTKEDRYIWLRDESRIQTDQQENPLEVIGSIADISKEKLMQQALRASEQQYRRIVETTAEGIWLLDDQEHVVFSNRRMAEMLGTTVEALNGASLLEFVPDEGRENARSRVAQHHHGVPERFEFKLRRRDGGDLYVLVSSNPIFDDSGNYQGLLAMCADITERKKLEEQFLHAQKLEAIGRLAGGVAHDFNNLLTGISGYTQLLLDQVKDRRQATEDLLQIRQLAEHAAALTHQLLAFSRKQHLKTTVVDLNALIGRVAQMLVPLLGEDIDLRLRLTPDLLNIEADEGQMEQALMNLALNSRDAMPDGGMITIETENLRLGKEGLADEEEPLQPGDYIMVAITDNGCGMDETTRRKIFEPFFTTKSQGKGTGLGLSTVYGIIRQHGGHIRVYSEVGVGTTFRIYLKAAAAVEGLAASEKPLLEIPANGIILLAEDETAVRALIQRVLESRGYRVLAAAKPEEAEALFESHRGEIILLVTDVIMPGGSGPELYRSLVTRQPGLKVLFISGYTESTAFEKGLDYKTGRFMQKPFQPVELLQKVEQLLQES